jgi:hypothetical protein
MDTDTLFPRHRSEILHPRAISDALIDARRDRYLSFEGGDWETFSRLMRFDLPKWPKTKITSWKGKVTSSGGGVVIKRFDRAGAPSPPPYARLEKDVLFGDPKKGAKRIHYAYPPTFLNPQTDTKRIDMHPVQPEYKAGQYDLTERVDVYFCLEGSLKADAVLSTGHTAFSSTSVTTWEGRDLKKLLMWLKGDAVGTVYVVCDSDFIASKHFEDPVTGVRYFNPSVYYFTRMAAQWLVARGVNAVIAYPWTPETQNETVDKLGVDDFLALGYRMEDLDTEPAFPDKREEYLTGSLKITPKEKLLLDWLLTHQGTRGGFRPGDVARVAGMNRKTAWRAYKRFEELGFMRVWEGWPVETDSGYRTRPHQYVMFELIHGYRDFVRSLPVAHRRLVETWGPLAPTAPPRVPRRVWTPSELGNVPL